MGKISTVLCKKVTGRHSKEAKVNACIDVILYKKVAAHELSPHTIAIANHAYYSAISILSGQH